MANRLATEAVSVPQTRIGMRLIDMPGARVRISETMKLIAPTVVEMPRKIRPEGIDVDIDARVVFLASQGHVVEPAGVGRLADQEGRIDEDARRQDRPSRRRR